MNNIASGNFINLNLGKAIYKYIGLALVTIAVIALNLSLEKQDAMLVMIGGIFSVIALVNLNKVARLLGSMSMAYQSFKVMLESFAVGAAQIIPKPAILEDIKHTQEEREFGSMMFMLGLVLLPSSIIAVGYFYGLQAGGFAVLAAIVSTFVLMVTYFSFLLIKNTLVVTYRLAKLAVQHFGTIPASAVNFAVACVAVVSNLTVVVLPTVYFASLGLMVEFGGETGYSIVSILFASKLVGYALFKLAADAVGSTVALSAQIIKQMITVEVQDKVETISKKSKSNNKEGSKHLRYDLSKQHRKHHTRSLLVYGSYAQKALKGIGLSSFKQNWILQSPIDDSFRSTQLAL